MQEKCDGGAPADGGILCRYPCAHWGSRSSPCRREGYNDVRVALEAASHFRQNQATQFVAERTGQDQRTYEYRIVAESEERVVHGFRRR
jgi:hypothetical protein